MVTIVYEAINCSYGILYVALTVLVIICLIYHPCCLSLQMVMDVINDVAELKRLHAETEVWIDKTLDSLGWSRENLLKVHSNSNCLIT